MATVRDLIPYIYHEKQEPGEMLCAQHALNSLLQGQYFGAPDLSEIARELDEDENRELDHEGRAATSNNMDDTGFFSVQVLQRALSNNFELSLVPWNAEELRPYHEHPHTQMAFILNHAQHWYTLRRFGNVSPDPALDADPGGGHWFNLNSFNDAPERIGKLYLGMFLQSAQQEGYSIFAVIQRDPSAKLALPRVEVDELFSSIPEDSAGNFSSSYQSSSAMHGIEGLEDEDMELQAALQASLAGASGSGDHHYQEYQPHFAPPRGAPQDPPSRTTSGVPIRRDYQVIEDDDEELDDDMSFTEEPAPVQPLDPVAASMARQTALLERMRRTQEMALREQLGDEVARIEAAARRREATGGAAHDDEDEMFRRALAESEALAQSSRQGSRDDAGAPPGLAPAPGMPSWQEHRVYDDEDEELQAALRASLETVPPDFRAPSPPPAAAPRRSQASTSQETTPPARTSPPAQGLVPPPLERQASSDIETESEAEGEAEAEQLSMEEIRKRRLARFGG